MGGYTAPENWANGYLGEKLYLRYLRDAIAAKRLDPDDALGANLPSLNLWVRRNVDPLVLRSATGDKPSTALAARGSVGMEAFIGLVLYVQTLLPPRAFAMALWGIGSTKAEDFLDSTVTAVSSMKSVTFRIPAVVKGKSIWLPIGKGELAGGTITERDGNWAKVKPSGKGPIRVTNPG
ncbi:MAG: hypothetical protein HY248_04175 [Fimbriimonas ginsengisoli]|nr:hypothetical protein [Fimbriimonas ginsengisoli]